MAAAVALSATVPSQALAWGDDGHIIIAAIAYGYLNPKALKEVKDLLAADHDGLTGKDFERRATWADHYRDTDRTSGPRYVGTNKWHYVDVPYGTKLTSVAIETGITGECPHPTLPPGQKASLGAPAQDCVVDKILHFERELADTTLPQAERIFALKFLLHFVGDVHQPLHGADNHDQGGNCVFVSGDAAGGGTKLHSYWDTSLINLLKKKQDAKAYGIVLRSKITAAQKASWENNDPRSWGAESYRRAYSQAYALKVSTLPTCKTSNEHSPIPLPQDYESAAATTAKERLMMAGVRLAYILNAAFPET